jgi:parvulin-like peptidyl-prolyl isomerase
MKLLHLTFVAALAALSLVVTACGSEAGVPEGVIAVVDGSEITREELDELVAHGKRTYEAQQQEFPRVGTPEYQNVQKQYVAYLVQREQFQHEADELGIEVTEKDVDAEVKKFVDSNFSGKKADFDKALKAQGFTIDSFRETLRSSVLAQKLYDEVTKGVKVPEAELLAYYQENSAQYTTPESRDVRHILVAEKGANDQVDFAKSKTEADRIYAELQNGGDFAALAKELSVDTVSAKEGGKLTITRGQTVPEFDKTSFDAKEGVVSKPVKTTYGYHIIEALSPVREAKSTPFKEVRASIQTTLLQEKKSTFMEEWAKDLRDEYDDKTRYAIGFEPPELPAETTDTTETETTLGTE